jgi:hypothetical protein
MSTPCALCALNPVCKKDKTQAKPTMNQQPSMTQANLLGLRRVLGDGLGALRHGVFGKFARQNEAD